MAFSSAAFLSSTTASGKPLTNSTTSGRRARLFSDNGELVHREPVVVVGIVEIDHPRLGTPHLTLAITVLDSYAIDQQAVQCSIARDQLGPSGRVSLRNASSSASAGSCELSRASASRK